MYLSTKNIVDTESLSSYLLDGIRFLAAFTVLIYHISFYFITPALGTTWFPAGYTHHWWYGPFFAWASSGYQAVMIFFVLSGYLVGGTVLRAFEAERWSWKVYLVHRFTRLWIVLLPALLLTAIWAFIQIHLFGTTWYFKGSLNTKTLLGNIFFLQNVYVSEYGGNGPLWSLTNEFWYYMLFPCLLLVFRSRRLVSKMVYACILVGISLFIGPKVMEYWTIWLLGAAVALVPSITVTRKPFRLMLLALTVVLAVTSCHYPYRLFHISFPTFQAPGLQFIPDAVVGLCFALLIYVITSLYSSVTARGLWKICSVMAGFSYTLYLTHYPLLHFLSAVRSSHTDRSGLVKVMGALGPYETIVVYALLATLYSFLVSRVTENQTRTVRTWLMSKL